MLSPLAFAEFKSSTIPCPRQGCIMKLSLWVSFPDKLMKVRERYILTVLIGFASQTADRFFMRAVHGIVGTSLWLGPLV
jgi:hypothetical protein